MGKQAPRSRACLAALAGLLVCLCAAVDRRPAAGGRSAPLHPALGITAEGVAAVRPGMPLSQVVAILGAPPGSYRAAPADLDLSGPEARQWVQDLDRLLSDIDVLLGNTRYRSEYWDGAAGTAWVGLDQADRVVAKSFIPTRR